MSFKQVSSIYWDVARPHCRALIKCRGERASVGFLIALPLLIAAIFLSVTVGPGVYAQSSVDSVAPGDTKHMGARVDSVGPPISTASTTAERLAMDHLDGWISDTPRSRANEISEIPEISRLDE